MHQTNFPHLLPHSLSFSPKMVNYHDPDVLVAQQDNCAYAFAAKYMGSGSQLTSFDSGNVKNLACHGRNLLVCPPHRRSPTLMTYPIIIIWCLSLAGSLLPLLITSGVSSGGSAPFVGQYGFVSMHSRSGRWTSVSCLADLFHYAHIHSCRCNTYAGGC